MAIERIHLENFKTLRDPVTLDLAPCTLLFGPNSAGKSAVADAVQLVAAIAAGEPLPTRAAEWVHLQRSDATMVVGVGLAPPEDLGDQLDADGEWSLLGTRPGELYVESNSIESKIVLHLNISVKTLDVLFDLRAEHGALGLRKLRVSASGVDLAVVDIAESSIELNLRHPVIADAPSYSSLSRLTALADEAASELPDLVRPQIKCSTDKLRLESMMEFRVVSGNDTPLSLAGPTWTLNSDLWDEDEVRESFFAAVSSESFEHLLRTIKTLVLVPMYLVRQGAKALCRLGPLRRIPAADELQYWLPSKSASRAKHGGLPEDASRSSWWDGAAAWRLLAHNPSIGQVAGGAIEPEPLRLVDLVGSWLSSPQRLDMGYRIRRVVHELHPKEADATPSSRASLPSGFRTADEELVAVFLEDLRIQLPVALTNVGTGVPQVVPVLVAAVTREFVFIEQPELHLHPRLQGQLADYMIAEIRRCESLGYRGALVIETHSEHMALRLLRRIREAASSQIRHRHFALEATEIAFFYFEPRESETVVHRIRVDSQGRFVDRWPRGFFDERAEDLFFDLPA